MALPVGTRLGPYEIASAAGAGGMGEVYRARDTRLGRDVAIKILPETFASDTVRLHRFEQEVQVLSALNHPNILGVYDVGESAGLHYFVTELLEGKDLRERLKTGSVTVRKAIEFGVQIAHGLAAAHEKGIVHRDLKPENVYITNDGRVKLLDFGLAKLVTARAAASATVTMAVASEAGTVLGTAGYMSPEQVRGNPADHRSDLFSFGVVLYEMIAQKKAFAGDSSVEVMNAIRKEDPPDLSSDGRNVPPALERIIRRCLEKNPEERFQSARDLGFALEAISAPSSVSGTASAVKDVRRPKWPAIVAASVLALGAVGGYLAWKLQPREVTYTQLTFESGYAGPARFSRDGNTVIYSAAWNDGAPQMYVQRSNTSAPQILKVDAEVVGTADTGDMAVILNRRFLATWLQLGTLARLPIEGGTPRPILDGVYSADIRRDGTDFAVVRSEGGEQRLEYPIGKVLFRTPGWISDVRISPDGKRVAFLDHPIVPDDRGTVSVVDSDGKYQTLTPMYSSSHGLAWRPDGKEIWYSGNIEGGELNILAVTLSGKVRTVMRAPIETQIQDISESGKVLLESIRYTIEMGLKRVGDKSSRVLAAGIVDLAAISADGQWLTYNFYWGPEYHVYLRRTDGAAPVLLGDGYGAGITYDSQWVAAIRVNDPHKLLLHPTGAGESRAIDLGDLDARAAGNQNGVTFTRDGRFALLSASNPKGEFRDYLVDLKSGSLRAVTPIGSQGGKMSSDGSRIITMNLSARKSVLIDTASGTASDVPGLDDEHDEVIGWTEDGKGLTIWSKEMPAKIWILDVASGRRKEVQEVSPVASLGAMYARLVACADGSVVAYRLRRGMYGVYLAEGLK